MKAVAAWCAVVLVAAFALAALRQLWRGLVRILAAIDYPDTPAADHTGVLENEDLERGLRALAEIRFDFETGKLDERDYQELRRRYEGQVAAAMRRGAEGRGGDTAPSAQVQR